MKSMFPLGVACFLGFVLACSSSKDPNPAQGAANSTGGNGGSNGGNTSGASSCNDVCAALMAQGCFYGGGESDCRTGCNTWETEDVANGPDYCREAWDDFTSCVTSATLVCNNDNDPDWNAMPCREHWDHVQNYCILGNATPETPCMVSDSFDVFCSDPAMPVGKVCRGDAPADCVVGGTNNNADLYCCAASAGGSGGGGNTNTDIPGLAPGTCLATGGAEWSDCVNNSLPPLMYMCLGELTPPVDGCEHPPSSVPNPEITWCCPSAVCTRFTLGDSLCASNAGTTRAIRCAVGATPPADCISRGSSQTELCCP